MLNTEYNVWATERWCASESVFSDFCEMVWLPSAMFQTYQQILCFLEKYENVRVVVACMEEMI